mmetsp:Transcript_43823/g.98645  ORF Transcript_43823/g.98645 Transcript_43823/m.98645 type:complete len:85 (-) Transcript_43823:740-994(-)
MFRFFKVLKVLRELRTILRCLIGSSLIWSSCMITLLYYIFAMIFLNGAADFLREDPAEHDRLLVEEWYGTLWKTMQTIYPQVVE